MSESVDPAYVKCRGFAPAKMQQAGKRAPGSGLTSIEAMSYGRMKTVEPALAAEVEGWLSRAAEVDAAEDREHGPDWRGDEMPDWMADKQRRLEATRAAKTALEQDRLEAEAADPPDPEDESGPRIIRHARSRCLSLCGGRGDRETPIRLGAT